MTPALPPVVSGSPPPCVGSTPAVRYVLTSMEYAMEIHEDWARVIRNTPGIDPRLGSVQWHLDWVARYKATMALICGLDRAQASGGAG